MKRYLVATALVAFGFGLPGARANTALFTFPSSTTASAGTTLGTSQSYTDNGVQITLNGEECTSVYTTSSGACSTAWGAQPDLYVGTNGLGVVDSQDELMFNETQHTVVTGTSRVTTFTDTYNFVQVDFSQAVTSLQLDLKGLGGTPTYAVYGLTSPGQSLGVLLYSSSTTGSSVDSPTISTTGASYTAFNILIDCSSLEYGAISSIDVTTAAPEPGTCLIVGIALAGLGLGGRKLRRRSQ